MICTSALCKDIVLYLVGAMAGITIRKFMICLQKLLKVNIKKVYEEPNQQEATMKHLLLLGTIQLVIIIMVMQIMNIYYKNTSYFFMGLLTPQVLLLSKIFKE
jgi:hypothetical protein